VWVAVALAALGISSIASAAVLATIITGEAQLSAFGVSVWLTAPGLLATGGTLGLGASLFLVGFARAARLSRDRRRKDERMESSFELTSLVARKRLLGDQIAILQRKLEEAEQKLDEASSAAPVTAKPRRPKRPFPRMPEEPVVVLDDGHLVGAIESEPAEL
jgi:hypothetical protein